MGRVGRGVASEGSSKAINGNHLHLLKLGLRGELGGDASLCLEELAIDGLTGDRGRCRLDDIGCEELDLRDRRSKGAQRGHKWQSS